MQMCPESWNRMKVTQIHEGLTAPADEGSGPKVTTHLLGSDLLLRKRSALLVGQ